MVPCRDREKNKREKGGKRKKKARGKKGDEESESKI